MAFKNDWTPGIFPIIAEVGFVVVLALWVSAFFESYPEWVSILVFVILIVSAATVSTLIVKRKKIKNKR